MKVIEDLQSQIDDNDRLMIAKDTVIDTLNDDLEEAYTQHSTYRNDGDNEIESNSLKFKCDNCSFEGKTMKD